MATTPTTSSQSLAEQAVSKGYVKSVDEYNAAVDAGTRGAKYGYKNTGTEDSPYIEAKTSTGLTPTEISNVEKTIKGFSDYSASGAVDSGDGIAKLIANYKKQIDSLNKNLKDTSNFYYTQQGEYQDALTEAEKALQKSKSKKTPGTGTIEQPQDELGGTLDYVNSQLIKTNNDLSDMYNQTLKQMNTFGRTLDEQNQATISTIKDTYERRRQQQIQENNATIAGLGVAGIRSGRTRYAPEMQDMLISEQERANITKLTEIDAEQNKAIIEANTAYNNDNFELFIKKMQTIESAKKAKAELVQELYDNSIKYDNQLLQRRQEQRLQESQDFNQTVDMAKLFAPTVLNQMTGNKKQDDAMLAAYATQLGVDPEFLRGAVQTAVYEENQAAKERAYKYSASKEDKFSFEDTVKFGLPTALVGTPKSEVAAEFSSPTAPWWFVNEVKVTSGKPDIKATDQTVVDLWSQYRDEKKASLNSDFGNAYDSGAFNLNPQTESAPEQQTEDGGWWGSFMNWFSTTPEKDNNVNI